MIDPLAVVLSVAASATVDDPQIRDQLDAALKRLPDKGWRVVSLLDAGDDRAQRALTSADRRTTVALVYPPVLPGPAAYEAALPQLTSSMAAVKVAGQPLQVTGVEPLREGGGGSDRPIIVEIAFGAGGAIVALTLLPVILATVGPRLEWPHRKQHQATAGCGSGSVVWLSGTASSRRCWPQLHSRRCSHPRWGCDSVPQNWPRSPQAVIPVPVIDVKIFATTPALGIVLDATIVRSILTSALVAWFGDLNWWSPFHRSTIPDTAERARTE